MANPFFWVYTGCMYSGKTTQFIHEINRLKLQDKNVLIFKPKLDDRYSDSQIVSHDQEKISAISINSSTDILQAISEGVSFPDVVAIDEAFMLEDSSEVLKWLFFEGVSIIVASLELSFAGKPFREIEKILPLATKIQKFSAVCSVCKQDAFYTYKKVEDDTEIQVGGKELYEPRCWSCHPLIKNSK